MTLSTLNQLSGGSQLNLMEGQRKFPKNILESQIMNATFRAFPMYFLGIP